MGWLTRWLTSDRWRESRLREDAAGMLLLVGSFFGHQPPRIEPQHTVIGTPKGDDRAPDELEVILPKSGPQPPPT